MALKLNVSAVFSFQNDPIPFKSQRGVLSFKPSRTLKNPTRTLRRINMAAANQSDSPREISISHFVDKATSLWDSFPQPVKIFPWRNALENFIQLILDLAVAVIKYLSVPLFVITSISEMSYCAHERKLFLVPFPFLVGIAVAGVLRDAALESSPYLKKNDEVPWHLIAVAIFFVLLKLPGPYYPYWGRVLIPHIANGALWRTLWFMFLWYRKPLKTSENNQPDSTLVHNSEANAAK